MDQAADEPATVSSRGQESDPEESHGLPPDEEGSNDPEGTQPAEGDPETAGDERDDIIKKLREENAAARVGPSISMCGS